MQLILVEVSKYVFAILLGLYAVVSFLGITKNSNDKDKESIYILQNIFMFAIHLLGYLILFQMNGEDMRYIIMYLAQLIYLFTLISIFGMLYPKASKQLINNMAMLLAIGFIIIARLEYERVVKQFIIACGSTIICFIIPWLIKKIRSFRNMGALYAVVGLVLLVGVLLSGRVYGANLVLSIGSVSVQPAEFVKILFVMYVASAFNKSIDKRTTIITTVVSALHVIILVLCKDLGSALILFVVYICMLFVATKRLDYPIYGIACGCFASVMAYELFSHVRQRVQIWLDPWSTIDSTGYQICQSLFSIGMGSWFGFGLCQGMPELIPVAEKDFIFSAITEEFGVVFAVALILICLSNLILIMNIAARCKTLFYRLVAVGLGVTYGVQVFLTIGGALKMIPMTGVTLPFVSYGGSSVLSSLVMVAIINGMYNMRQDEVDGHEDSKKTKTTKGKRYTRQQKQGS